MALVYGYSTPCRTWHRPRATVAWSLNRPISTRARRSILDNLSDCPAGQSVSGRVGVPSAVGRCDLGRLGIDDSDRGELHRRGCGSSVPDSGLDNLSEFGGMFLRSVRNTSCSWLPGDFNLGGPSWSVELPALSHPPTTAPPLPAHAHEDQSDKGYGGRFRHELDMMTGL